MSDKCILECDKKIYLIIMADHKNIFNKNDQRKKYFSRYYFTTITVNGCIYAHFYLKEIMQFETQCVIK
jgi:hypothetical protein